MLESKLFFYIIQVCNCFINAEKFEPAKAKEWLDRAIEKFPKDKITINLTEKLFESIDTLDQRTFSEWQEFLIDAMVIIIFFICIF